MTADMPEEIPDNQEDTENRIQNLLDRIDHAIDSLGEDFEEIIIITRKTWLDEDKNLRDQMYYRFKNDPLVCKSLCDIVSKDIGLELSEDLFT